MASDIEKERTFRKIKTSEHWEDIRLMFLSCWPPRLIRDECQSRYAMNVTLEVIENIARNEFGDVADLPGAYVFAKLHRGHGYLVSAVSELEQVYFATKVLWEAHLKEIVERYYDKDSKERPTAFKGTLDAPDTVVSEGNPLTPSRPEKLVTRYVQLTNSLLDILDRLSAIKGDLGWDVSSAQGDLNSMRDAGIPRVVTADALAAVVEKFEGVAEKLGVVNPPNTSLASQDQSSEE